MRKIILLLAMAIVLAGFSFVVSAIEAGEWQTIDDDLVIVGTGDNNYLMWPKLQTCTATNFNNIGLQWKTTNTAGQPTWSNATNSYIYPDGETAADYPAFAWAEDVDYKSYTDWRLPTLDELLLSTSGRTYISYTTNRYWAATEYDVTNAYTVNFLVNYQYENEKIGPYVRVRAVRDGYRKPIIGTVKDSGGIAIENAKIIITNQGLVNETSGSVMSYYTTSNSTGGWSYAVDPGNYLIVAYDPNDSTTGASTKPHIVVE